MQHEAVDGGAMTDSGHCVARDRLRSGLYVTGKAWKRRDDRAVDIQDCRSRFDQQTKI